MYIVHKRFKSKAICGNVNIPKMTLCDVHNGIIQFNGKPICVERSRNAHLYFANNDDNRGLERGELTSNILKKLATQDSKYQKRWDIIWENDFCQKYRRKEHIDQFIFNHDFYIADIESLKYIADLIGVQIKKED